MEYFDYIGKLIFIILITATVFMGLIRITFGNTSGLTAKEKSEYRWSTKLHVDKEFSKRVIPQKQFKLYWFFVNLYKYSFPSFFGYILIKALLIILTYT